MDDLVASRRAKEKDGGRKEGEQNWNGRTMAQLRDVQG